MHTCQITRSEGSAKEARHFETTDLYLGCFLKAKGLRILRALRDGRRTVFVFADTPDRAGWVEEFYNDGVVRVNDFKNAMQDLKGIIYNV
jgi:hypothetical protein